MDSQQYLHGTWHQMCEIFIIDRAGETYFKMNENNSKDGT